MAAGRSLLPALLAALLAAVLAVAAAKKPEERGLAFGK